MGLFFNYNKPGPGVDKNAPKKKGIFLYIELFFRKFWLLIKANMLYALVSLPVLFIYNFIIISSINTLLPSIEQDMIFQISVILTVILAVLWGTGPVSLGYTYLLRNFAREEHTWLVSDFFEKIKENFKLGITVFLLDIAVMFLSINAISVYVSFMRSGMGFAKYALAILFFVLLIYTFMHFYVFELGVTFENTVAKTIRNAIVMAIATLPVNLFLLIFTVCCTVLALQWFNSVAIIIIVLVLWMSLMRFPIDFCSARKIKRQFIRDENEWENVE